MPFSHERKKRTHSAGIPLAETFPPQSLRFWWDPGLYPEDAVARVLFPMYVWRIDEQELRRRVIELGLIQPGHDSPLVTNNTLVPLMGIIDVKNLGYSSFEPEFATLVRAGKTDRRLWLAIFEMLEYSSRSRFLMERLVGHTLRALNLTIEQILTA
jgi:hypothetical protein